MEHGWRVFYQVTKPPRLQPENSCKSLAINIWPAAVTVCVYLQHMAVGRRSGCSAEATWSAVLQPDARLC